MVVALGLGYINLVSTSKSIRTNLEIQRQSAITNLEIQRQSAESQLKQLNKSFENSLDIIKAERAKRLFFEKKKSESKRKEKKDIAVKFIITNVNSTIIELNTVLKMLNFFPDKSLFGTIFFIRNNYALKDSISVLSIYNLSSSIDEFSSISNNNTINYVTFCNNVKKTIILSQNLNKFITDNFSKSPDKSEVDLLIKVYNLKEREVMSLVLDMQRMNMQLMMNFLRIMVSNTIMSGYDVLKEIEKISDDKTITARDAYYTKLKEQIVKIENESKKIEKMIKKKAKPLLGLSIDQIYNIYEPNNTEQSHSH